MARLKQLGTASDSCGPSPLRKVQVSMAWGLTPSSVAPTQSPGWSGLACWSTCHSSNCGTSRETATLATNCPMQPVFEQLKTSRLFLGLWNYSIGRLRGQTHFQKGLCGALTQPHHWAWGPQACPASSGSRSQQKPAAGLPQAMCFHVGGSSLQTSTSSNETKPLPKKAKLPFPLFPLWCQQLLRLCPPSQIKWAWQYVAAVKGCHLTLRSVPGECCSGAQWANVFLRFPVENEPPSLRGNTVSHSICFLTRAACICSWLEERFHSVPHEENDNGPSAARVL